jgi:hypothetical protein
VALEIDINCKPIQEFKGRVPGVKVKPVDTTGAGDAFVGGMLSNLAFNLNLFEVNIVAYRIRMAQPVYPIDNFKTLYQYSFL